MVVWVARAIERTEPTIAICAIVLKNLPPLTLSYMSLRRSRQPAAGGAIVRVLAVVSQCSRSWTLVGLYSMNCPHALLLMLPSSTQPDFQGSLIDTSRAAVHHVPSTQLAQIDSRQLTPAPLPAFAHPCIVHCAERTIAASQRPVKTRSSYGPCQHVTGPLRSCLISRPAHNAFEFRVDLFTALQERGSQTLAFQGDPAPEGANHSHLPLPLAAHSVQKKASLHSKITVRAPGTQGHGCTRIGAALSEAAGYHILRLLTSILSTSQLCFFFRCLYIVSFDTLVGPTFQRLLILSFSLSLPSSHPIPTLSLMLFHLARV